MAALPVIVDDLVRRWSLEVGQPFQPGGETAWVAPACNVAGERLVLVVGETSALLLEACEPGTVLSQVLPPPEQDVVVAGLLRRLWIEPPVGHPFRALQSMCDWWADEFEEKYATAASGLRLDPGLARAGIELFRSLPGTAPRWLRTAHGRSPRPRRPTTTAVALRSLCTGVHRPVVPVIGTGGVQGCDGVDRLVTHGDGSVGVPGDRMGSGEIREPECPGPRVVEAEVATHPMLIHGSDQLVKHWVDRR